MKPILAPLLALTLFAGCGGSSNSAQSQNTVPPPTTNPLGAQPIETGGEETKEASEEAGKKAEESKEASEEAGKSEEAKKAAEEAKEAAEEH